MGNKEEAKKNQVSDLSYHSDQTTFIKAYSGQNPVKDLDGFLSSFDRLN